MGLIQFRSVDFNKLGKLISNIDFIYNLGFALILKLVSILGPIFTCVPTFIKVIILRNFIQKIFKEL